MMAWRAFFAHRQHKSQILKSEIQAWPARSPFSLALALHSPYLLQLGGCNPALAIPTIQNQLTKPSRQPINA